MALFDPQVNFIYLYYFIIIFFWYDFKQKHLFISCSHPFNSQPTRKKFDPLWPRYIFRINYSYHSNSPLFYVNLWNLHSYKWGITFLSKFGLSKFEKNHTLPVMPLFFEQSHACMCLVYQIQLGKYSHFWPRKSNWKHVMNSS